MNLFKYYSDKRVQEALLKTSKNREIAARFNDNFGKRPDILQFESDVLEFVKKGATSFHFSEEHWSNPLLLKSGMTKNQLDSLRVGWDLILDIDGPLEFSKITANFISEALQFHDVENFTVKYSGNKGFHIAVPFNAFPEKVDNKNTRDLFPEGPRIIASYLKEMIKDVLTAKLMENYSVENILEITKKQKEDILHNICPKCDIIIEEKNKIEYKCEKCSTKEESDVEEYNECPSCKNPRIKNKKKIIKCSNCGLEDSKKFKKGNLNPFSIVDIDTVLISNRHLFRAPYSYHEKSGLISIPIKKENILNFNKEQALPENVKFDISFLSDCKNNEASKLIEQAFAFNSEKNKKLFKKETKLQKQYSPITQKVSMELFPSSIKNGLLGLEDGKKRFLFVLLNFLKSLNYDYEEIEKVVYEWNKKNKEPLKEGYLRSQLSWHKRQEKILPPNFINKAYYDDIGLKPKENEFKFKNPVNYSLSLFRLKHR